METILKSIIKDAVVEAVKELVASNAIQLDIFKDKATKTEAIEMPLVVEAPAKATRTRKPKEEAKEFVAEVVKAAEPVAAPIVEAPKAIFKAEEAHAEIKDLVDELAALLDTRLSKDESRNDLVSFMRTNLAANIDGLGEADKPKISMLEEQGCANFTKLIKAKIAEVEALATPEMSGQY